MQDKLSLIYRVESVIILIAIASLWPRIFLGWSGTMWFLVECSVLAVLAAIFIRRTRSAGKGKRDN